MSTETVPTPPIPPVPPTALLSPEGQEPAWLAGRLERERAHFLRELGVEKVDDAKAALAAHKAAMEAQKTELQRATEKAARLDQAEVQLATQRAALTSYAAVELGRLTPEQKAAVVALAGDDPTKQLAMVNALRPTWGAAPAPAAPLGGAPPSSAAKPLAAPMTTLNAPPAPPAASSQPAAPENYLGVYEDLKKNNPIRAAQYLFENYAAIDQAKKTRAG